MRIAIIGQSLFGAAVYKELKAKGYNIVGVFTIPDDNKGRPDPLAKAALDDGIIPFKFDKWQALKKDGGKPIPSVIQAYNEVKADLNVLAFVSLFIPMEVINYPVHGSIVYHPSLLPRHRGASAINWTLLQGDKKAGFTIFYADDGLDTGPILLMKECDVLEDDTVGSLYNNFLFPEGVKGMCEAVKLIQEGKAPKITQPTEGATYDKLWKSKDLAKINWDNDASTLHNFIRANDPTPGAHTIIDGQQVTLTGSTRKFKMVKGNGENEVTIEGNKFKGIITQEGLIILDKTGNEGLLINKITFDKEQRTIPASNYFKTNEKSEELTLTEEETVLVNKLKQVWSDIINVKPEEINSKSHFFNLGAASMDVVRLVSTVKQITNNIVQLDNDSIFLNPEFNEFINIVIKIKRNGGANNNDNINNNYLKHEMKANDMNISFPTQLFIDGEFVNSEGNKTFPVINPATEEVICNVSAASPPDVDKAVSAAYKALNGPWSIYNLNARERGRLLYKLADAMEACADELATIESLDSGAVFTLALKTHVGMSIETFRYFAGWCDKIQGDTIPINHAKPSRNLCMSKRLPIGVVGLIVPWNYPLMMIAWKAAAALAAGCTVIIKPAQVTPLTALKLAELSIKVGIPKGVINILNGSGTVVGNALTTHEMVKKIGFTGSTPIGRNIMSACSGTVKKVSLELGGKSPLIIFADADMKKAVKNTIGAVLFNKGENCIAAGRIFVEESIHDEFLNEIVNEMKKLKIGDPLDRATSHGPQNHAAHFEKLLEYVKRGVSEGAKLVYGGVPTRSINPALSKGFYFTPAVFTDVTDDMWIAKEESFGPVMIITKFKFNSANINDIDKLIHSANATEYGLCAGVFTNNISLALRISDSLEAGTVFINTYNKTDVAASFGGFKQSGFGKDLGELALNEYLQTKTITIEY